MARAQVYLTAEEREALQALSALEGRSQSELIREALRPLLKRATLATLSPEERRAGFEKARGMWKDRDDLPDLDELRGRTNRQPDAA
ncbi:MAG: ribbon-helix-helix protein, CopG family [Gemmatimonadetes bacterium]|nr:ribbon-helix-helix protein, CopG family [Gemmatimonadota bacterium]